MICGTCRKDIPNDSAFCPFCGATVSLVDKAPQITNSDQPSIPIERQEEKQGTAIGKQKNRKKWFLTIAISVLVLVPILWLLSSAAHYSSPIPQLNASCAKYISDYHNLRLGMSYSEVKRILGESVVSEMSSDEYKFIVTKDKISFGVSDSDYEVCAFKDDILVMVDIVFESKTLYRDNDAIAEHFSALFGEAYHKGTFGGSYDGRNFYVSVMIDNFQPPFDAKIDVYFGKS